MPRAVIIGQAVGAGTSITLSDESLPSSDDMSSSLMLRNPPREMGRVPVKPEIRNETFFVSACQNQAVQPVEAGPVLWPGIFGLLHFPYVGFEYLITTSNARLPALNKRGYRNQARLKDRAGG